MASGGDMEEVIVPMSMASTEDGLKDLDEGKQKIDRHCAFCLTLVKGEEIKVCGGCKRRAYCSKECQKADWKATPNAPATNGTIYGYGQGHKNWCGLEVGEEDLDWKVVPISGKGLGIVAVRDIPYLYRILVEGMQHPPGSSRPFHPALSDLHPPNSDVLTKFTKNQVESVRGLKVGLRLSRINHSCRPNASFDVDHPIHNLATFTVIAEKEIKAGEEICRSYMMGRNFPFQGGAKVEQLVLTYKTPEQCRKELSNKWGIVCPPSCPCRDEKNAKLLEELKELGEYCKKNPLKKPALEKFQKIIENAKEFGIGLEFTGFLYILALELAVAHRETLEEARKYLKTVSDMLAAVLHPKATSGSALTDVSRHPNFLAAER